MDREGEPVVLVADEFFRLVHKDRTGQRMLHPRGASVGFLAQTAREDVGARLVRTGEVIRIERGWPHRTVAYQPKNNNDWRPVSTPPDPPQLAGPLEYTLRGLLRREPRSRMRPEELHRRLKQVASGQIKPSRRLRHRVGRLAPSHDAELATCRI